MNMNNTEYLINQYADASALMLADDLYSFAHSSGLRANFDKTQAVWIKIKKAVVRNTKQINSYIGTTKESSSC